jgi:peptidoglycan/LPS O-acetylase OafA/YrhL
MKNNMKMISFAKHEIVVHRWRKRFIRVLTALVVAVVIIVAFAIGLINHGYCGNAEKAPTPNFEELPTAATERENAHPITFFESGVQKYEGYKRFIL